MQLRLLITLFFSVLIVTTCFSQNTTKIDSLQNILATSETLSEEEKSKIYITLARLNRRTNPEQQLINARLSFKESKKISDLKNQGIALSEIAAHYHRADNYDSAYFYFNKAIPYFRSEKNIANSYSRLSNVEKARGNYVESISLLIKSDSIYERVGFKKGRLANNTNLGIILSTKGDYEEAIFYYKKAEEFLEENDLRTKSTLYNNFAITYNLLNDLDNSKKYNKRSIAIDEKLNDIIGLANAYGNLSMIADKEGDVTSSISYMEKAKAAYQKMNNKNGVAGALNSLGSIYRIQGDFKKAEEYLLTSNALSEETQNHEALMSNQEALYKLYRDTKTWDKAFVHLASFNSLKDSITEIEKLKITKELQTKYETDRVLKEKELAESNTALAEERAENNKNFSIAMGAIGLLLFIAALFGFYRFKAKKKEEVLSLKLQESEKQLKLEQQTRVSELKALQSQMNPHFVFNALNSIQDLILLQDIRNSNKYLGKFSDLIRRILTSSNAGSITISEEIITLKLYAELEQLRFGEQLQISFKNDVPEEISEDFLLPVMFIQPYIENALKHGLLHKEGEKKLTVHFYVEKTAVVCSIDDNGVGREKSHHLKIKGSNKNLGFSTQANQERIDLLNAGRTKEIKIQIVDKEIDALSSGTTVLLYFPIREV